jgi:FlaA1/EpsC-like NDP-sugar epimerase
MQFVGLQPGEKLHEDLYEKEFLTTSNPAIVKLPFQNASTIARYLSEIDKPSSNREALVLIKSLLEQIDKSQV